MKELEDCYHITHTKQKDTYKLHGWYPLMGDDHCSPEPGHLIPV